MLEIKHLSKSFGGVKAISDVTLAFPTGSLSAVIGPNGAGKSTFFNLISGGLRPTSGEVVLNGVNLVGKSRAEIIAAGIGRAFQIAKIFPTLTVREALLSAVTAHQGRYAHMLRRFPLAGTRDRVAEVADMLGLAPCLDTLSANLSHGDQKLLDIALALVLEPRVLLLDEPTEGLAPIYVKLLFDTIKNLRSQGLTVFIVEQNVHHVLRTADRAYVLENGRLVLEGRGEDLLNDERLKVAYLGL
jgi:branched-chain amino acid transport system ATP-binding protein